MTLVLHWWDFATETRRYRRSSGILAWAFPVHVALPSTPSSKHYRLLAESTWQIAHWVNRYVAIKSLKRSMLDEDQLTGRYCKFSVFVFRRLDCPCLRSRFRAMPLPETATVSGV